jgi:WD40 repeat protein
VFQRKEIWLWEVTSGQLIRSLLIGHRFGETLIAFMPDGQQVVYGSGDSTICAWDALSDEHIGLPIYQAYCHTEATTMAVSPDGKHILSAYCTISLWDAPSGQLLRSFKGHKHSVRSVAFSPDGKQIDSGSDDHIICIWDLATGQLFRSLLNGHRSGIKVVFSFQMGGTLFLDRMTARPAFGIPQLADLSYYPIDPPQQS